MKHYIAKGVMTALGFGAMMTNPALSADTLIVSLDTPPAHYRTELMQEFLVELEAVSDGSLKSELFHSSQLYSLPDVARAVARGDVGLAVLPSSYLTTVVPDFGILDLPLLNGLDSKERNALNDGALGQALAQQITDAIGVVVPGNWWEIGNVVYFSSRPLTELSDFEGLRIRIPGTPTLTARVEALGASAVPLPFTDTPLALQQGVVDGLIATPDSIISNGLTDAGVEYAYWDYGLVGHSIPLVSQEYWGSLSEEQQQLFSNTWNEFVDRQRQAVIESTNSSRVALEELGVTWTDANAENIRAATDKLLEVQPKLIEDLNISDEILKTAQEALQ